jgi:hypothetical protein
MQVYYQPDPTVDLIKFKKMVSNREPFTFIRFSDGEIEILRNRFLKINNHEIIFKGKTYKNIYPDYDSKLFDPNLHSHIRNDLLEAAKYKSWNYYIGIPSTHNNMREDRDYLVSLQGGVNPQITFADIFINSNYSDFKRKLIPLFNRSDLYIVCNFRSIFSGPLERAIKIPIGDNFFATYEKTFSEVYEQLINVNQNALILSSASSLSNILGHKLHLVRPDVTFLDIGTSLNYLMGLKSSTRLYHKISSFGSIKELIQRLHFRFSGQYKIRW